MAPPHKGDEPHEAPRKATNAQERKGAEASSEADHHHSKVHAMYVSRQRLQLYNQNRADLERAGATLAKSWAHVFLYSESLLEAKSTLGGYYINMSLVATLLSGVAITCLLEADTSGATVEQKMAFGLSGILAFGVFLATALDCVLIDNSTRKLRSYSQVRHLRIISAQT